jgi:MarR-like DNA-binding transcriptional regulator SgrR of sgrS sRNA
MLLPFKLQSTKSEIDKIFQFRPLLDQITIFFIANSYLSNFISFRYQQLSIEAPNLNMCIVLKNLFLRAVDALLAIYL